MSSIAKRRRSNPARITPRPLNDGENVRQIIRDELSKALALPAGAQTTNYPAAYLQSLQRQQQFSGAMAPLPNDPNLNAPFSPGQPLNSAAISPLLPSGRPAPRQWEYPVSWNLQTTTTRLVPWSVLRDVADQVPVVRSCIDTCKAALTGLDWSFSIDSRRARALAKRSGTSSHEVIVDLQDKFADDIERLHQWWAHPMRGKTFTEWLNAVLEDETVYDAVALYPRLSLGGDLLAAEIIDASTVKPLLDERGGTPIPPLAAYQQILWGFPRGDYQASPMADIDGEYADAVYGPINFRGARTDALIYKVRNQRSHGPYGFSAVEASLPAVDLWLKRWEWLKSEYTSGVTPEMIVKVAGNMTPEQLRQYEAVFNDDLSGRSDERHRARFLPDGFDPSYPENSNAKFASDLDLHIIRLICAAFGVLPTSLGFTPNKGMGSMGSSGHHQGESDAQLERSTKPRASWVVDLINEISINYLGMPPEVTFVFHGLNDDDEQKSATLLEGYLGNGLMTLNEGRDQLNLPRYSLEQANEPFIDTPTGPAFFNPEVQPVGMPGNLPSADQNSAQPQKDTSQPALEARVADEPRDESVQGDAAKAERKAFMAFIGKAGGCTSRDFLFNEHPPEVAEAANRLAAAGDVDAVKALFELASA